MSPGLTPDEVRALQAARHKPLYLIAVLSAVVNAANLTDSKLQCADGVICGLTDAVATCDKLVSTPIPTLYSKFSNRFLMMVRAHSKAHLRSRFFSALCPDPINRQARPLPPHYPYYLAHPAVALPRPDRSVGHVRVACCSVGLLCFRRHARNRRSRRAD